MNSINEELSIGMWIVERYWAETTASWHWRVKSGPNADSALDIPIELIAITDARDFYGPERVAGLEEELDLMRERLRRTEEERDSISAQLAKENSRWRRLRLILKEHEINV